MYSAIAATVMSLALIPLAFVFVGVGAALACTVYAITLIGLFTVSATYHRHTWTSERARTWMKRADHSMIFVFIAGSYTPLAALALHPPTSTVVLIVVWVGAAGGVALKMLWPHAPRWLGVPFYLALGWVAVFVLPGHPGQRWSRGAGADRGRRIAVLGGRHFLRHPPAEHLAARPSATTSTSTPACRWRRCVTVSRSGCCCSASADAEQQRPDGHQPRSGP